MNGQSLVLARVDTMRHYDQQLNAYQKDGRLLAAQGQKLEHIEEKVQGNNARVEQVEKVVQSLQEKGKDAPMVWPWVAAGGGLLATIAGLGTALYFWKKHQSRKAKTVQGGLYSETEDDSEIDSGVDRFRSLTWPTSKVAGKARDDVVLVQTAFTPVDGIPGTKPFFHNLESPGAMADV